VEIIPELRPRLRGGQRTKISGFVAPSGDAPLQGRHLPSIRARLSGVYEGSLVLFTKVMAGRLGSGFGGFFFGFLTSRRRASLFPMPDRMPQFRTGGDILRNLRRCFYQRLLA
jgi:hypothetical protein